MKRILLSIWLLVSICQAQVIINPYVHTNPPNPVLTNLISAWKLTADATDYHGPHDLTNNNGVSFASGYADFDGSNYLSLASHSDFSKSDEDWTFTGWFYLANLTETH